MNTTYRIDKEKLLRTIERDGMKPAEFYYELLEITAVGIIRAYDMGRNGRDLTERYPYIVKVAE